MPSDKKPAKKFSAYLKYSGVAFQMVAVVFVCFFIGNFIDKYISIETPVATILSLLLGFSAYMFKLYKDLFSEND